MAGRGQRTAEVRGVAAAVVRAGEALRDRENAGVECLVAALHRAGRVNYRDALFGSVGGNLQVGRHHLDIALSRKVIHDI